MIFLVIFFIVCFIIIALFSFPQLSPIPYFPSQRADLPKIIKALDLKNNQTVFDLGAGDGIIIFGSAISSFQRKLNTKFIAVEINPVLILILHLRRLFHPNKKNIKIIWDDMFKFSLSSPRKRGSRQNNRLDSPLQGNDIVIYIYISPWFIDKTLNNIKRRVPNFSVVSYMYPIKSLKKSEKIIQGKNSIFVYS